MSNELSSTSSGDLFVATFNQAAVGMAHVGLKGEWLRVNDKICQIVGYTKEELLTKTFQDITHPDDLSADLHLVQSILDGQIQSYELEKRYIHRKGHEVWINLTVSLVRLESGRPDYFISVVEDIQRRKVAEFELLEIRTELEQRVLGRTEQLRLANEKLKHEITDRQLAERQLSHFFEISADGIVISKANGEIVRINPAFAKMLGCAEQEIVGTLTLDTMLEDDVEAALKTRSKLRDGHKIKNFEARHYRRDRQIVTLSWAAVYSEAERLTFSVVRDISLERQLHEEMAAHKMQLAAVSKLNSLARMASGIAHEINNPLTIILGQALLLNKKQTEFAANEVVRNALSKIEKMADRISKIISGLRNFSRDGSLDPMVLVPARQVIEETVALCQSKFIRNQVRLLLPSENQEEEIYCRPVQVSQVLLNLLENSCDAVVGLHDPWVRISIEVSEKTTHVVVEDSGQPLKMNVIENLFQPFFTTKPVGQGSGLGLSISKGIMKMHQGDLYLDEKAEHPRFIIVLPKVS